VEYDRKGVFGGEEEGGGVSSAAEFLAALKRVAPPPQEQLEVGAKVELHSLNATEHNEKHGKLLEYNAETQRWVVELSEGCSIRVCTLKERECCLLVLNLVSSTLPCIRQPRPRLRVLDVCGFV
jgi:hypothetical protein